MRVMAGALEGDLFIGPKAEVIPWNMHLPGLGVSGPRNMGSWSELYLLGGHLFSASVGRGGLGGREHVPTLSVPCQLKLTRL